MQTAVTMHMAQKYSISDKNDDEIFDFLKQNFGCNRKVYNLCVSDCVMSTSRCNIVMAHKALSFPLLNICISMLKK